MRLTEFAEAVGVTVSPVDRLAGFMVEVGVPSGWEPFESVVGARVWVCRTDPCINQFGANAVLVMHRVEAVLDVGEVFEMLVEQQVQSVPSCRELHRELIAATEGAGVRGALGLRIVGDVGAIDSVAQSRIIATEKETLIAQLTVTALQDSPANRDDVWLTIRSGAVSADHRGGVPLTAMRGANE